MKLAVLALASVTAYAASEDCRILELGCGEARVGASANIAPDRVRSERPSIHTEAAFGLTRFLAATGTYAHTWFSTSRTRFGTSELRFHEITGGLRFQVPNASRITPYLLGVAGGEVVRLSTDIPGIRDTSDTRFIAGGGGGFEVRINRHVGLFLDARVLTDRHRNYYIRPSFGFYLRGR